VLGPRGTGALYQLAYQRLMGLLVPDDVVNVIDTFARPELWALHQGSLWSSGNLVPLGVPAGGLRAIEGVELPATTSRMLSIVEGVRITQGAASEALFLGLGAVTAAAQAACNHRDVRRANNGISGLQAGVATRAFQSILLAIPTLVALVRIQHPALETRDYKLDWVLEPGSAMYVLAVADATAVASSVEIYGRERSATEDEIQI
jgi:hypothetical protein